MQKIVLFFAFFLIPALSQASDQEKKTLKRNSVGNQEVELSYGISLDRDCQPLFPIRIAVVKPPRHGVVRERSVEKHTSFKQDNPRHACNTKKSAGIAAFYQAKDKFKGIDRFQFAIVYFDGTSELYDVEMTVWGP
jgi:hypothetical protein